MSTMKLYHVNCDDWDGSPHGNDLWVRARTPEQAVVLWQRYYGLADDTPPVLPDSIDEVPETGDGAIPWDTVPLVWVNPEKWHRY